MVLSTMSNAYGISRPSVKLYCSNAIAYLQMLTKYKNRQFAVFGFASV